jgi:nicotinamidase-related amidase
VLLRNCGLGGPHPFLEEATRTALSATGRKTRVLCGFATEVVVLHAARGAIEAGYKNAWVFELKQEC